MDTDLDLISKMDYYAQLTEDLKYEGSGHCPTS